MNWDAVLADLANKVDDLERRLEEGVWEDLDQTPFAPPEVEDAMSPQQREWAVELLERVAACRRRLAGAMDETRHELDGIGARRDGARSYATSEASIP